MSRQPAISNFFSSCNLTQYEFDQKQTKLRDEATLAEELIRQREIDLKRKLREIEIERSKRRVGRPKKLRTDDDEKTSTPNTVVNISNSSNTHVNIAGGDVVINNTLPLPSSEASSSPSTFRLATAFPSLRGPYNDWVGDYFLFKKIVRSVEKEKSWKGAVAALQHPLHDGDYEELNESTVRSWYFLNKEGKYQLKEEVRLRWEEGAPIKRPGNPKYLRG
jgi:hypothetical protein